jgi:HK97 family phage prohead protease
VDGGGDVVEPGAYTKTLKERGSKVPLLWQHKTDVPIGELTLEDRDAGLWAKGQLMMADPIAQRAYLYIKAKIVKGLSIGFEAVKDTVEKGVRHLKEIKLYEGSIVTFPMNELALIASVKGDKEDKGDFNEELTERQLSDANYQMRCALMTALDSVFYSKLTKDQAITLSSTIIEQFSEAYLSYLPSYIDMLAVYYGPLETWADKEHEIKSRLLEKSGAEFSASNVEKIRGIAEKLLDVHQSLTALVEAKAGSSTLETKEAADTKPEPVDHSAELAPLAPTLNEILAQFSR